MANKNVTIKRYNGSGWDVLYPISLANNVSTDWSADGHYYDTDDTDVAATLQAIDSGAYNAISALDARVAAAEKQSNTFAAETSSTKNTMFWDSSTSKPMDKATFNINTNTYATFIDASGHTIGFPGTTVAGVYTRASIGDAIFLTNSSNDAPDYWISAAGSGSITLTRFVQKTTIPQATVAALGGIKLANDPLTTTVTAQTYSTLTDDRVYGLQLDQNGKAFINVPWTNTTYSAGNGIKKTNANVFQHDKEYTAATTQKMYPMAVDAYGHVDIDVDNGITPGSAATRGATDTVTADSTDLVSGKAVAAYLTNNDYTKGELGTAVINFYRNNQTSGNNIGSFNANQGGKDATGATTGVGNVAVELGTMVFYANSEAGVSSEQKYIGDILFEYVEEE